MKQQELETRLRGMYVDPPVPETLSPQWAVARLRDRRKKAGRRLWALAPAAIAAAVLAVALPQMEKGAPRAQSSAAEPPAAEACPAAGQAVADAADYGVMPANVQGDAAEPGAKASRACPGKPVEGAPSTKPGCLPGCTQDACLPECPNYQPDSPPDEEGQQEDKEQMTEDKG